MTSLDNVFDGLVTPLIRQFGKRISYTAITVGAYDVDTLTVPETRVSFNLYAAVLRPTRDQFDNDLVRVGDRKLIAASKGFQVTPTPGDIATIDGAEWKVLLVEPMYSGELIAAYQLFLRG